MDGVAKVLLHLSKQNLLAVQNIALVMGTASLGAGLITNDQIGHSFVIVLGAGVRLLGRVDGHAIVLAWGVTWWHG